MTLLTSYGCPPQANINSGGTRAVIPIFGTIASKCLGGFIFFVWTDFITAERFKIDKRIDSSGGEKMVGLESSMDNALAAKKVKAKEDPAEKKRLDAFNAKLRARKAPQPK